jgi:hypothetical protein
VEANKQRVTYWERRAGETEDYRRRAGGAWRRPLPLPLPPYAGHNAYETLLQTLPELLAEYCGRKVSSTPETVPSGCGSESLTKRAGQYVWSAGTIFL